MLSGNKQSNSLNSGASNSCLLGLGLLATLLFVITGCSFKPWADSLAEDQHSDALDRFGDLSSRDTTCPPTLEADLSLFYQSPIETKAVQGYFLFSLPESYKFVVTNPFGQTLWAVAGNHKSYQVLNTQTSKYIWGNLDSYALKNDIPLFLINSDWGNWVTGRTQAKQEQVQQMRADSDERGIWYSLEADPLTGNQQHILIASTNLQLLSRLITDKSGSTLVEINYSDFSSSLQCVQPQTVQISGLDFGTEIRLELDRIALLDDPETFKLPVPESYFRQYLP